MTTVDPGRTEAAVTPVEQINLIIDGFEVSVPKGTLVIRAAEQLGIQIPRFCDHPLLAPVGACRQCLVDIEINGRAFPKPQASCTIPVENGMIVKTQLTSEVAQKAQEGVMELLLVNHPLDCPTSFVAIPLFIYICVIASKSAQSFVSTHICTQRTT